jgi:hypothetical protein
MLHKLSRILSGYEDEGPAGEGWQSIEVIELRGVIDAAINAVPKD